MKRVTKRAFHVKLKGIEPYKFDIECSRYCDDCTIGSAKCDNAKSYVERLAAIEDILGDDYDLDWLRDLVEADRDGLCKIFPFDIGDVVYTNLSVQGDRTRKSDRPYAVKVVYIGIGDGKPYFHVEYQTGTCFPFDMDQIGKIVFLTREEAEAALKGENHG